MRWTAWGLLALGPLLGGDRLPHPPGAATTAAAPHQRRTGNGAQGAAGFATLFVGTYLRAGEGDQEPWPPTTRPRKTCAWKEPATSCIRRT